MSDPTLPETCSVARSIKQAQAAVGQLVLLRLKSTAWSFDGAHKSLAQFHNKIMTGILLEVNINTWSPSDKSGSCILSILLGEPIKGEDILWFPFNTIDLFVFDDVNVRFNDQF